MTEKNNYILFYDGDCGFCNRSVALVLKYDVRGDIAFAALQSDYAVAFFAAKNEPQPDMSTLYFWDQQRFYTKSNAAFRILRHFPWYWQPLHVLWLVPRFIRDAVYDQIAKRRKRISKGFCVMPSQEQRSRFLD